MAYKSKLNESKAKQAPLFVVNRSSGFVLIRKNCLKDKRVLIGCLILLVFIISSIVLTIHECAFSCADISEKSSNTQFSSEYRNLNYLFKKISKGITYNGLTCERDYKKIIPSLPHNDYRIVCYYVIPSNETHTRQLPPSYVDPYLCTHIIIGFAAILNGTLAPVKDDISEIYKTIIKFKEMNPSMKVLLSVEDFSSKGEFAKMVADESLRSKFSSNIIQYLESMKFDGIDLDWEFPSWPSPNENQKKNFTLLLQSIRKEFSSHNTSFILSAAVGAPETIVDQSYHIHNISRYVDFINLMAYDYHLYTKYLPLTGPNAPLYPNPKEQGYLQTMNVNWSATHWHQCGMPLEKINVGIPTYGHSFRLINEDNNGWNAPSNGFGNIGADGFIMYSDVCQFISNAETTSVFDEYYLVPYAFRGKTWISYDNQMSIENKAKFIKENKFGGAMIYSLNSDDFYGECGTVKFPLLRQIINILTT